MHDQGGAATDERRADQCGGDVKTTDPSRLRRRPDPGAGFHQEPALGDSPSAGRPGDGCSAGPGASGVPSCLLADRRRTEYVYQVTIAISTHPGIKSVISDPARKLLAKVISGTTPFCSGVERRTRWRGPGFGL